PPLLGHYEFPENWRIVTILDHANQGVHGKDELKAFKDLPTFPLTNSQAICHLTLMKLLPALAEEDIESFGEAITNIQSLIGDHFAPAQGGRYTSQHVASLLNHAQNLGHKGIAQSSWGPTGCIFVDNENSATQLIEELKQHAQAHFDKESSLSFAMAQANSSGANIEITTS
ncbi:MAG: beta-hydroxylase, partial [Gammaproteobacteria bacterium]|nr:beta-hydroxylase [Gammaproteobacteria bacterium]